MSTDLQTRLDSLLEHIGSGRIMEAMEKFYAMEVVMEEPRYGRTEGLAANLDREQQFVDSVAEFHRFDVTRKAVGEDSTFYEVVMEWTTVGGEKIRSEQVVVADWREGKIVRERFYYDTGA